MINMTFWRCGILISKAMVSNRLRFQNLGSKNERLSAVSAQRVKKKHLPPSPCGRPVFVPDILSKTDTRTIDQAVGGAAEPNISVFSMGPHLRQSTITDLGAAWVGLLTG